MTGYIAPLIRENCVIAHALISISDKGMFKNTTLSQLLLDYDTYTHFDIIRSLGKHILIWVDNAVNCLSLLLQELTKVEE